MRELTERAVEILSHLVAFDTTSNLSNLPIVDYIEGLLAEVGCSVSRLPSPDGRKAGILAHRGPRTTPGLMLSAHTDVVPAVREDWSHDPFQLHRVGNQLVGRGACDMKGFIACVLAWVESHAGDEHTAPIWIAFSRDEELGCVGAPDLVEEFLASGAVVRLCIVGEPTEIDVVTAHKGILQVRASVTGTEAHSSLAPRAVNAVHAAARAVAYLSDMAREREAHGPFDDDFDIPHSTIHTGTITGGTVANIVPKNCAFEFELRYLPGERTDAFLSEVKEHVRRHIEPVMKDLCQDCGFEFAIQSDAPAFDCTVEDGLRELVTAATAGGKLRKVAFATDAGHFGSRGIPTLVCGPGSIENAHRPDESISVRQLSDYLAFLERLGSRLVFPS